MPVFLSVLIIVLLLLLAAGLVMWLLRHGRSNGVPRSGFAPTWSATSQVAGAGTSSLEGRRESAATDDEAEGGPETVLSYLDVPDPLAHGRTTTFDLSSQFDEDFAPATLPQPLVDMQEGAIWRDADPESLRRIHRALQALGDGPVDQAWETLRGFYPEAAHREAALETFERIALAFERVGRYDGARDVYEHMADIDPQWRQVKLRLMRARGLAQAATANTWGTVPPRPLPKLNQRELGKYIVERQIGKGAMGAVYLGYDPATDRQLALKTMALAQEFSGEELAEARGRFLREAEMAGRLHHPDIVSIIDAGEQDGLAFIAMELVGGVDLSQHAQPGRLLPVNQLLPIIARVADALAYAHTQGVTHRDVKPANIMVDLPRASVKVMDFGVARVADATRTRTGVVLGTPTFMSPEQLSGQTIDGRSDLYSLGVTLFQLLTGHLPYRNDSMAALMRAIGQEEAPNVCSIREELPAALGDIVALALEKHPTTRYANGLQMAEDLRAVALAMQQLDIELG
jgi:tRNA A-37 threonylcarbamoyl transferase component Bud32